MLSRMLFVCSVQRFWSSTEPFERRFDPVWLQTLAFSY